VTAVCENVLRFGYSTQIAVTQWPRPPPVIATRTTCGQHITLARSMKPAVTVQLHSTKQIVQLIKVRRGNAPSLTIGHHPPSPTSPHLPPPPPFLRLCHVDNHVGNHLTNKGQENTTHCVGQPRPLNTHRQDQQGETGRALTLVQFHVQAGTCVQDPITRPHSSHCKIAGRQVKLMTI
jgi:hypothetical protein